MASSAGGRWSYRLYLREVPVLPTVGLTESDPVLTSLVSRNEPLPGLTATGDYYRFDLGVSGSWFDPPTSEELFYTALDYSLFSSIRAPSGFSGLTVRSLEGEILDDNFGEGKLLYFDTPISGFSIFGFDSSNRIFNPGGFPLQIFFTESIGSFAMSNAPFRSDSNHSVSDEGAVYAGAILLFLALVHHHRFGGRRSWTA